MHSLEFTIHTDRPAKSVAWRSRRARAMLKHFKFAWESTCMVDAALAPTRSGIAVFSSDPDNLYAAMEVTIYCNAQFDEAFKVYLFCEKLQSVMNLHGYNLRFVYKELSDETFEPILNPDPLTASEQDGTILA